MDVLIAGYRISRLRNGSGGTYDDVPFEHYCFTIAAATFHLMHYCLALD